MTPMLLKPPPLSLYIHFPWCLRRCPYCDFNSHGVDDSGIPQKDYLKALLADLSCELQSLELREITSIFIGGGTPSLIEPDILANLLQNIHQQCTLANNCEITLEANPGTFELERFRAFQEAGITRLSLGIQSLNDSKLQAIGRIHNAAQAKKAIEAAQKIFATFNLDLMYALPMQTLTELQQDLRDVLSFSPPHLSIYHLTIENNTYFSKYPPQVPEDDLAFQMLDLITEQTNHAGLQRYEVSAYAKDGQQCKHNQNYWEYGDYIGIGAGAHGKITQNNIITRYTKYKKPRSYMSKILQNSNSSDSQNGLHHATSSQFQVPIEDRCFEFMLNALRLKNGVSQDIFSPRTGIPLLQISQQVNEAIQKGLLLNSENRFQATSKGFDFLSDLQEIFLNTSA